MNLRLTNAIFARDRLKFLLLIFLSFMFVPDSLYAGKPILTKEKKSLNALRINIQGTVKNEKGEPLPGVSIKQKGSKTTSTTDQNGIFRLNLPTGNEVLIFSYVGFKSQEVALDGRRSIEVVLQEDNSALDEVVVVGYGEQKRIHLTGAVSTIKGEELEDLPVSNVGAALQGRVLGVGVSGGTRRPGNAATLTLRNPMSVSKDGGNNQPLYVIDGVIQVNSQGAPDNSLFNSLVSSEIEAMSFLKDGAAAVYGSRGANGVVLVTTKKGQKGAPRISYNSNYGIADESYRTKMLNAYEFAQMINIMNGPYGANADTSDVNRFFSQDELDHFQNINYDWLDPAWSAAFNMNHSLNISGGTDRATYFANVSYYQQEGNLASLDYDRWNFRAGTNVDVAKGLNLGLQVSGNTAQQVKTFNKVSGENDDNDYRTLLTAPPYVPMYIDGLPVRIPGRNDVSRYHYYEIQRLNNLSDNRNKTLTFNVSAEYKVPFVEGLSARLNYGRNISGGRTGRVGTYYDLYTFNRTGRHEHIYDQGATVNEPVRVNNDNRISIINDNAESYQANFTLNYAHTFGKHSVSGLFSVEKGESESFREDLRRGDPLLESNGQLNTAFGEIEGETARYESGTLSYVGRANWSYADKYMAEFLFRSDASTKFAPENYWGKFYSLSAGWVLSSEEFFSSETINFLKFRYSFGLLGKDDTRAWQWRQRYTYQNGYGGVFGESNNSVPTSIGMRMEASPNRNATWSTDYKHNFGVDARFLDNRLSTTAEFFFNRGTNMLLEPTGNMPITIGGSIAAENFAAIDMFGTELEIGWDDKAGADFRYGASLRFSWYDNKVRIGNFNDQDIKYPWNPQPGHSSDNGMWGYDYLGMFRSQEEVDTYVNQNNITQVFGIDAENLVPGMLYYRDVRGQLQADGTFAAPDGVIDENDQIRLSSRKSNPYGVATTLRAGYKSLNLNVVISGSFGGYREYDGASRESARNNISESSQNKPAFWNDIFDPELNPGGKYPNPYWDDVNLSPTSEFWRVNSLSLQVRNINVSYSLPGKWTNALGISNARAYVTAVNPFNLYNPFDFKDPDNAFDVFPVLRTYSFGVNFTF